MLEDITSKIMRNCSRMTALIKDLLTLADIENIPSSRLTECNLNELVNKCCSMLLELFPDTQVTIDKPAEGDVYLVADADLLDLAILYANLCARLPGPGGEAAARANALAILA